MKSSCKSVGKRLICPSCGSVFVVCQSCYTGHRYCSIECRKLGRRSSLNRTSAYYQKSSFGRINHRERQKRYRKNRALQKSVTHQTSVFPSSDVRKPSLRRPPNRRKRPQRQQVSNCLICGQRIDWFFNFF